MPLPLMVPEITEEIILNRKLVVDALIAGEYEQCAGALCKYYGGTEIKYCAIGASIKTLNPQAFNVFNDGPVFNSTKYYTYFADSVGLKLDKYEHSKVFDWIIRMNDTHRYSSEYIGRCLEMLWKLSK